MTGGSVPDAPAALPPCRCCEAPLTHLVVDLGMSPLANRFLTAEQCREMEPFYPLRLWLCTACGLVQLEEFETPERIFTDYAYFSSYSDSWVRHARDYAEMAIARFGLGADSRVVEIASNDGYLLQHFVARGIPVLGIEPAANVAEAARARGIPTVVEFFGTASARRLAAEGVAADLVVANNVLAHTPALRDFVAGLRHVLRPGGTVTLEFPHLERLLAENQFDTIYHEHFSYFSLTTVDRLFRDHGLRVVDVEELPTHGGSLRVYAQAAETAGPRLPRVDEVLSREAAGGLTRPERLAAFAEQVEATKRDLLEFLIAARRAGRRIAGYGAPGKSTTLLNYCGIRTDFLEYTVDRSPVKQGRFLPGTHIPIHPPEHLARTRPDYVLILPWNLKDEIMESVGWIRDWGGQFVVPIPEVKVLP
ncbi:MAG TPA: class I SAM-dependent methyltransferase [Candidatus Binatia bacterium]|nr:class I SAM-dependent methyltransferase [Candidatus Binatia bacterium]